MICSEKQLAKKFRMVKPGSGGSERLLTLRLNSATGPVTLISMNAPTLWEALCDTMYRTALATFGKRSSKSHDWFEAKSTVMTPVIEAK